MDGLRPPRPRLTSVSPWPPTVACACPTNPTRRRNDMRTRLTKLAAALVASAALAVGGSTLASAGSKANPPAPPAASQSQQEAAPSIDGDNVQQGDQSAPDSAGQASESAGE